MWIHLTSRANKGKPLLDHDAALWLWRALRRHWPSAFAACLMLEHLHLLLMSRSPEEDHASLARLLGSFSRSVDPCGWTTAEPQELPAMQHVRRMVRYIHLNPCRAKLVDDPLAWLWSTHRAVVGAEVDPWVTGERMARALGAPLSGFAPQFHRFVTADSSVNPSGTPFPKPAPSCSSPEVPLRTIVLAARAATPSATDDVFHRTAILLAGHQGWRDTNAIAGAVGVTPRTVRRILPARVSGTLAETMDQRLLTPAALCLGDERLRRAAAELTRLAVKKSA